MLNYIEIKHTGMFFQKFLNHNLLRTSVEFRSSCRNLLLLLHFPEFCPVDRKSALALLALLLERSLSLLLVLLHSGINHLVRPFHSSRPLHVLARALFRDHITNFLLLRPFGLFINPGKNTSVSKRNESTA